MATQQPNHARVDSGLPGIPRTVHPGLAWAGIVGPVLFTATFLVQEAFRRATYDPLAEPVSALEVAVSYTHLTLPTKA